MIKDILVSLPVRRSSDAAVGYAISVATAFDAHLAGLAFVYEPTVPGTVFDGLTAEIVATFRAQSEKAGKAAIAKFDDAVRRAGVSAESRMVEAGLVVIDEMFAQVAHARYSGRPLGGFGQRTSSVTEACGNDNRRGAALRARGTG